MSNKTQSNGFREASTYTEEYYGKEDSENEGKVKQARFSLGGQEFICIDSPIKHDFSFTPSMSIYVGCESDSELQRVFAALAEGGEILMPLDNYAVRLAE